MEKKYLRRFSQALNVSKEVRKKIMFDLKEEISHRKENGEKIEKILEGFGAPEELAKEFNYNYGAEEKETRAGEKIRVLVLAVIGSICILLAVYNGISLFFPGLSLQYLFSGMNSEGNTAVFEAFHLGIKEVVLKIVIEVLLGLGIFAWIFVKKKK